MPVTLLIDGDPLVYACGFVAERRRHLLEWRDVTPDGDVGRYASFDAAWRRDRFIELMNLHPDEWASTIYSTPAPFGYAVQAMRATLDGIENHVGDYLRHNGLEPGESAIYLTGGKTFRDKIATIQPYKGNRTASRPYWYSKLREWMVAERGAIVTSGIEADDAIAMLQWQEQSALDPKTILCTVDKDLNMVPGLHYNTKRKEAWWQTGDDAIVAFYRQLLTGDATDNIPGCYLLGPAKAEKMIVPGMTERQMFEIALYAYNVNIERYPDHHAPHTDPLEALRENARLLHMLRGPDDEWREP